MSFASSWRPLRCIPSQYTQLRRAVRTKLVVQLSDELDKVNFEREQPVTQLNDVQPAFAALDLAYESLIATQAVSQIGLTHALAQTCKLQLFQEDFVVTGVQSLGHGDFRAGP